MDVPAYPHVFCSGISLCPVTFPFTPGLALSCFTLTSAACSAAGVHAVRWLALPCCCSGFVRWLCSVVQCVERLRNDVCEHAFPDGYVLHTSSMVSSLDVQRFSFKFSWKYDQGLWQGCFVFKVRWQDIALCSFGWKLSSPDKRLWWFSAVLQLLQYQFVWWGFKIIILLIINPEIKVIAHIEFLTNSYNVRLPLDLFI